MAVIDLLEQPRSNHQCIQWEIGCMPDPKFHRFPRQVRQVHDELVVTVIQGWKALVTAVTTSEEHELDGGHMMLMFLELDRLPSRRCNRFAWVQFGAHQAMFGMTTIIDPAPGDPHVLARHGPDPIRVVFKHTAGIVECGSWP